MRKIINPLGPHETLEQFFEDLARRGGTPAVRRGLAEFDNMVREGASFERTPIFLRGVGVVGTKPQITLKGVTYIFHSAYTQGGYWVLRVTVGDTTRSFSVPDLRLMLGVDVGTSETAPAVA